MLRKTQSSWVESKSFAYAVTSLCLALVLAGVYIGNRIDRLAKAIAAKN